MSELQLFTPSLEELVDVQVYRDALAEFSPTEKGDLPLVWALAEYPTEQVYGVGQLLDFAEHPEMCDSRTLRAMALAIISSNDTWNHLLCFLLKSVVEEFDVFLEMALYCKAKHNGVHNTVRETLIYKERDSILERIFALQVFEPVRDELLITSSLKFVVQELREHVYRLDKNLAVLLWYAADLAYKAESDSGVFPALYKCCTKRMKRNSSNIQLLEGGAGLKFVDVLRIAVLNGDKGARAYEATACAYLEELQKLPELTDVDKSALDRLCNMQLPLIKCDVSETFLRYVVRHYKYAAFGVNVLRCRCGEEQLKDVFGDLRRFYEALGSGINNYTGWELTEEQRDMVMKYVPRVNIGYKADALFEQGLMPLEGTDSRLLCEYFAGGWEPLETLLERYPVEGLVFPEEIFNGFFMLAEGEDIPDAYRCAYYWRKCDTKFFEFIDSGLESLKELTVQNHALIEKARKMHEAGFPFHLAEWADPEELAEYPMAEDYPYSAAFCLRAGTEVGEGKVYWLDECVSGKPRFAFGDGMPYIAEALEDERYVSADTLLEAAECCIKYGISNLWETVCFVGSEQSWYLEEYPVLQEALKRGLYSVTEFTALEIANMTKEQFEDFCCSGGETVGPLDDNLKSLLKRVENPALLCRVIQRFGWDDGFAKTTKFEKLEDLGKIPVWLSENEEHAMLYLFGKKKGLKAMTKLASANHEEFLSIEESSLLFDYRFVLECVDWESFHGFDAWQHVHGTKSYDVMVSEDDLDILAKCPCLQKLRDVLDREDYLELSRRAIIKGEAAAAALLSNLEKHPVEYYKGLGDEWRSMLMFNLDWDTGNAVYAKLLEGLNGRYCGAESVPALVVSKCKSDYRESLKLAGISLFRVYSEFEKFAGLAMDGTLEWFNENHWRFYEKKQWFCEMLNGIIDGNLEEQVQMSLSPNFCSPTGIPQDLIDKTGSWREEQFRRIIADRRNFSEDYLDAGVLRSDDLSSAALFAARKDNGFCLLLQDGDDSWAKDTAKKIGIPAYRESCKGNVMKFFICRNREEPGMYKEFVVEEINSGREDACTADAGDGAVA